MKLNTFPIEITFNIEFTSTYVLTNITKTNANFHSFVIPKLLIYCPHRNTGKIGAKMAQN